MKVFRFILFLWICVVHIGIENAIADDVIPCTGVGITCQTFQVTTAATANGGLELPITFDEFSQGTYITDQYAELGIVFNGDTPYIEQDGSTPTSPVLSGSPQFQGDIEGYFVSPDDSSKPLTVDWFSFTAGYFDSTGTTLLEWFDIKGNKLGEQYNSEIGIETFYIEEPGIASWRIGIPISEGNGFVIDNVDFEFTKVLLTKDDDVADTGCVSPETGDDNDITYTICYKNTSTHTLTDVIIVDTLPQGVDYPDGWDSIEYIDGEMVVIPGDTAYSIEDHTYTWYIGTVDPAEPNDTPICVTLDVVVNEKATPGTMLHNVAELIGSYCYDSPDPTDPNSTITTCFEDAILAVATEDTPVCCWGNATTIYVDINAAGANNGLTWAGAYNTEYGLKNALERAWNSTCDGPFTIYIAQGTYYPGTDELDSFDLLDEMEVYGGFPTGGCDFSDRNPNKYKAILSGDITEYDSSYTVVFMAQDSLLSGVTVASALDRNIDGNGTDFTLTNCIIENSVNYGVYSEYGNATIKSCMIRNNGADGIYHESVGENLDVTNSWVMRNNYHGIYCLNTTPKIYNSIVSESDLSNEGHAGVSITNPAYSPVLQNVTISNNKYLAVEFTDNGSIGDDPNYPTMDYPTVDNCIIYFNNNNSKHQVSGFDPNTYIAYSCVQECTEVNNNINDNPEFAYKVDPLGAPDPLNYHLSAISECIDSGNPNLTYDDQVDYDNEDRVYGTRVDRGADEVYTCDGEHSEDDYFNALDTNADGIVNLIEYQPIAEAWLSMDPNDPRWVSDPNFADPNSVAKWNKKANLDDTGDSQYIIDIADLTVYLENHLWQACWYGKSDEVIEEDATQSATASASTESLALMTASSGTMTTMAKTASTLMFIEDETEEVNQYDYLTNNELATLVTSIYELQDVVEGEIYLGREDEEDLQDILTFFDDVLWDIEDYLKNSD